jgi:flavin reductase (DIM6/NTAB) family NADH-FMN oxidoreductase RutF
VPDSIESFDLVMASLDTPMILVTAAAGNERAGCLVGFHAQSGIDPKRYCVWLSKANHTYRIALRSPHLGIHFLTRDDGELAELFGTRTGDDLDKFDGLGVEEGPNGVPLLLDCPHRLLVRRTTVVDESGDHVCVATEMVEAHTVGRFQPLRLADVHHLTPGHEAEERHSPPTERAAQGASPAEIS